MNPPKQIKSKFTQLTWQQIFERFIEQKLEIQSEMRYSDLGTEYESVVWMSVGQFDFLALLNLTLVTMLPIPARNLYTIWHLSYNKLHRQSIHETEKSYLIIVC